MKGPFTCASARGMPTCSKLAAGAMRGAVRNCCQGKHRYPYQVQYCPSSECSSTLQGSKSKTVPLPAVAPSLRDPACVNPSHDAC